MEKPKNKITREDIAKTLKSKGSPGENREAKVQAVKDLGLKNNQGIDIVETLSSYKEY